MTGSRTLIVNADDFGRSEGVNRGIVRADADGIVTSTTLMVRWPAAGEAARYAQGNPDLSVGLHVDLAEWEYRERKWHMQYEVVPPDDAEAIAAEIERQLERFHELVGRPPTHLDSHQHLHRHRPVTEVLAAAGERLGVPVRDFTPGITYSGAFYGQDGRGWPVPDAITVDALVAIIEGLAPGVTELGCHPGDDDELDTNYATERSREVETLCDPRVRQAIDACGVDLRSFSALAAPGK